MSNFPKIPEGLETKCDAVLNDLVDQLATIQESYKNAVIATDEAGRQISRGKYFQGLRTHNILPADGNKIAPDKTKKPADQGENWADIGIVLPSSMELAVQVDVYEGPRGWGYVVIGIIEIAKKVWRKAINVGPEDYRNSDWQEITTF